MTGNHSNSNRRCVVVWCGLALGWDGGCGWALCVAVVLAFVVVKCVCVCDKNRTCHETLMVLMTMSVRPTQ